MKKLIFAIITTLTLLLSTQHKAHAQLNKYYFLYYAREYLVDNRYRETIDILNKLLKTDTTVYEAYFFRGVAKYNLDDMLGAEADFTRAIDKNPVYTLAYQYRAITRSRLGNYDDALGDYAEALELRPDQPGPYYSRGVTYFLSQQFDKAVSDFTNFIRLEPKVADAYINRGTSYLFLKDTVAARADFNRAISVNRYGTDGYLRRGMLYMSEKQNAEAIADFNTAIGMDSLNSLPYFYRAITKSNSNDLMGAIRDFDKAIAIEPENSLPYFNRAILRSQIGDFNRALEDYNRVATYNPNNVLVFYNRAALNTQLGDIKSAIADYSRAIELYPDFANAYINRSNLRTLLRDEKGAKSDMAIAQRKIADYRSKLTDSTFSAYADTSRQFNRLLSLDVDFGNKEFDNLMGGEKVDITLKPLYRMAASDIDTVDTFDPYAYRSANIDKFVSDIDLLTVNLRNQLKDLPADSISKIDKRIEEAMRQSQTDRWQDFYARALTQSMLKQYTNSINYYNRAIELNPQSALLYMNRGTTRSEMIDFISSIDNSYQNIVIDSDPANRLVKSHKRNYNYDEAIADLDKAIRLAPDFAHLYFNRANLYCQSGRMPEAIIDYTRAIELYPYFAEAYYNRGLVQIYLKDTRKGCIDVSTAGELGLQDAYTVMKKYCLNAK